MQTTYNFATLDQAAEWLTEETGKKWAPRDLVEPVHGLKLYVWVQAPHDDPRELPTQMRDGTPAPVIFANDARRLAFTGNGELTMTAIAGKHYRFTPGLPFSLADVRVAREDLRRLAHPVEAGADAEDDLAELFDPVTAQALEKMFPAGGRWEKWAERAARNDLENARVGRGQFNPYRAAEWFLRQGLPEWDRARCMRVLAKNLPVRSMDRRALLTGELE